MSAASPRYLCMNCDLPFDAESASDPRCPKCMRKGVVARPVESEVRDGGRVRLVAGGVVLSVLVLGAGLYAWRMTQPATVGETVPQGPLESRVLRGHLIRLEVDEAANRALFASGDSVARLLRADVDSGSWPERARAVAAHYARLRESGRLVAPDDHGRRDGAFLAPEELAGSLVRPSGATVAGSLELALLAVVALREADVTARVVEIYASSDARRPPDRSGTNGYYGVLVRDREGARDVTLVDVAGEAPGTITSSRKLDDLDVVAAAITTRAQIALARDSDGEGALAMVDDAIRIDPQAVAPRSLRASLLAAKGATDDAITEAEAAEALRPDSPRLVMHASLIVARQDFGEAEALARRALALTPDFGAAYGILAAAAMSRRDVGGAEAALHSLEERDPTFDGLDLLWANVNLLKGDADGAITRLDRWVALRPDEPMVRMQAAYTLSSIGRADAALEHLRAAVDMVEGAEREALREQIGRVFGPSALAALIGGAPAAAPAPTADDPGAPSATPSPSAPSSPGSLDLGSPTLGSRPQRPSLLGPRP